jgi:hypothetical protein
VDFYAQAQEVYAVEVHFDNLFGTFAFRKIPSLPQPVLGGTAVNRAGRPAANQLVTLIAGDRRFSTRTDAQGRFAFRASTIKPGNAVLTVNGSRRNIRIPATTLGNIELRLAR